MSTFGVVLLVALVTGVSLFLLWFANAMLSAAPASGARDGVVAVLALAAILLVVLLLTTLEGLSS